MKDIRKVKIQSPDNICKASFFFGFTCCTFTTHPYLLFDIVTTDRNALSEPGNEFFYSSIVEISRLPSQPCHHRVLNLIIVRNVFPARLSFNLENSSIDGVSSRQDIDEKWPLPVPEEGCHDFSV
jgi:hypothetical protein